MVLKFTPQAEGDLIAIWEYIAEDNLEIADAYIRKIKDVCALLDPQPAMGASREVLAEELRLLPFEKYNVFYVKLGSDVTIIRIRHSAQDPTSLR